MPNITPKAVGWLLSLLIVSPQFLMVPSTAQMLTQPIMLSVQSTSSDGWLIGKMGNYSVAYPVERYTRMETWTNGTKGYFSIHFFSNVSQSSDMWVNCTAWLPENRTASRTSSLSTVSLQPLSEGPLRRYPLDNLTFIEKGANSTCFTTYEHDDNYEKYYPLQWNHPYDLQGLTKTHMHLTRKLLDYWVVDNITTAAVMGLFIAGYEYCVDKAGGGFLDLPKDLFETLIVIAVEHAFGWTPAVVVAVLFALAEIMEAIWQYLTKWWWIETVVREDFGGDGWSWRGHIDSDYCCIPDDTFYLTPRTIYNWHQVYFFNATWGSDGIFGPRYLYAVDSGFHHQTHSPIGPTGVQHKS